MLRAMVLAGIRPSQDVRAQVLEDARVRHKASQAAERKGGALVLSFCVRTVSGEYLALCKDTYCQVGRNEHRTDARS